MYHSVTADDFRAKLNLPKSYQISGLISYGAWDRPKHEKKILEILDELKISYKINRLEGILSNILEIEIQNEKYWFSVAYGGALLSEIVHLACLFGSKRNLHIGSCGGLSRNLKNLSLIIPTLTFADESTTRAYNRTNLIHRPDEKLSICLQKIVRKKYNINCGPIMTNQAMMGETWQDVNQWSMEGFYGVEMETSTMFAVSNFFNVPSTALVYISDNLIMGQTAGDDSHNLEFPLRESLKKDIYKFAIELIIN